jgi:hypothetical protein
MPLGPQCCKVTTGTLRPHIFYNNGAESAVFPIRIVGISAKMLGCAELARRKPSGHSTRTRCAGRRSTARHRRPGTDDRRWPALRQPGRVHPGQRLRFLCDCECPRWVRSGHSADVRFAPIADIRSAHQTGGAMDTVLRRSVPAMFSPRRLCPR